MAENTSNKTSKKIIELDCPSSRPMDMSPAAMAKKLDRSINTIKTKINALDLGSKDAFSIHNNGNYQMYNHECLPILEAFIGTRPEKPWLYTTDEFLAATAQALDNDPNQTFCRNFLYNQDCFRKYYLHQKLDTPIRQRLACIKSLSRKLDTYPDTQSKTPFQVQSIGYSVIQLDRIIYELANYPLPSKNNQAHMQSTSPGKYPAQELTETWCKDLLDRRKQISTRDGISYNGSISDPLTALEHRLSETLSSSEKNLAEHLTTALQQIEQQQAFVRPLDEDGTNQLEQNIQALLFHNMDLYLGAVFKMKSIPEFQPPADDSLNAFVLDLVREAYGTIRYASEELEKCIFGLKIWSTLNAAYFNHYELKPGATFPIDTIESTNAILQRTQTQIKIHWETMKNIGIVSSDQSMQSIFSDAIKACAISNQHYQTMEHNKEILCFLNEIISTTDNSPKNVERLLLAGSITLEYFWRKSIVQWASEITHRCIEYQKALSSFIE